VKFNVLGLGSSVIGAVMTRLTGIDSGEPPAGVTEIAPEYAPIPSPFMKADTVRAIGAAPDVGETVSHAALLVAVNATLPVPPLDI
jgi:hypothetical protein